MSKVYIEAGARFIPSALKTLILTGLLLWMPSLTADVVRPDLALWLNLKRALLRENGSEYFENNVRNALVPGGTSGVQVFRATLVSATPPSKPSVLVLAVMDNATPEATLKLDRSLKTSIKAGAKVEFQGIAVSFSKEPFMLTLEASVDDLKFEGPER